MNALDDEISFTLRKLSGVESCAALALQLDAPHTRIVQLKAQAASSTVLEGDVRGLIDDINHLRCELLGALTVIGCVEGRAANWPPTFFRQTSPAKKETTEPPRQSRGPKSVEDWKAVANDRASDAQAMLKEKRILGSVYMAGYAIECSLKALLRGRGEQFPTSGGAGHNLRALWKASGFPLRDLHDTNGAKTYFIENWCTDLRYDLDLMDTSLEASELLTGALALVNYIQYKTKHTRGHR